MVATRSRNEGNGAGTPNVPSIAEMAELLRSVTEELSRTRAELVQVRNQRDTLLQEPERSVESYPHGSREGGDPPPNSGNERVELSVHSTHRQERVARRDDDQDVGGNLDNNRGATPVNANARPVEVVVTPRAREFRYESFIKCGAKEFDGTASAVGSMEWLDNIEVVFESCDCPEDKKVLCGTRMLVKGARDWWRGTIVSLTPATMAAMTWGAFREKFLEEYCGIREKRLLEKEFWNLRISDKGVSNYARSFMEKLKFVGHLVPTEESKVAQYVDGLPVGYRGFVRQHTTLSAAIKESKKLEDDHKVEKVASNVEDKKGGFKRRSDGSSNSNAGKKFRGGSSGGQNNQAASDWCIKCRSRHAGPCSINTVSCSKCTGIL